MFEVGQETSGRALSRGAGLDLLAPPIIRPEPLPEPAAAAAALERMAAVAGEAGLRRVHVLAWRDLDDPEAGGSELHAHEVLRRWAAAGLDVTLRTSSADGHPAVVSRDGYRVVRRFGRYSVFPAAGVELALGAGSPDGVVEIWNGMPFFSPLFGRRHPRLVFLHHVHAEMWRMVLPAALAMIGETLESKIAPRVYERTRVVTLSESSRDEIVEMLGLPAERVSVVHPGVDERFAAGGHRSPAPLLVAVGRLVPVKRFEVLVDTVMRLRPAHPGLQAVIVGEGYEREALEAEIERRGATGVVSLPGRLDDEALVDLYRRAWVLVSTSAREGWGMTITEAAACGTPAVASAIAGHADAIVDGTTGFLATDAGEMAGHLHRLLSDTVLRHRLSRAAAERARAMTWDQTAEKALQALAAEAISHRRPRGRVRGRGRAQG